MQNLWGRFVVFLLGGQNRNFMKVRGLKLQLSQKKLKFEKVFLNNLRRRATAHHLWRVSGQVGEGMVEPGDEFTYRND